MTILKYINVYMENYKKYFLRKLIWLIPLLMFSVAAFYFIIIWYVAIFRENSEIVFSLSSSDWDGFGSYFGGVTGPILTFITIVILIITNNMQMRKLSAQLTQQKDELDHLKIESKNQQLEQSLKGILEILLSIAMESTPGYLLFMFYEKITSKKYKYDPSSKTLIKIGDFDENYDLIPDRDIFTVLNFSLNDLGSDWTKKEFIDNDSYTLASKIQTYEAQATYYLGIIDQLMKNGYEQISLKHYASMISIQYELLYKLKVVNQMNYLKFLEVMYNLKLFTKDEIMSKKES